MDFQLAIPFLMVQWKMDVSPIVEAFQAQPWIFTENSAESNCRSFWGFQKTPLYWPTSWVHSHTVPLWTLPLATNRPGPTNLRSHPFWEGWVTVVPYRGFGGMEKAVNFLGICDWPRCKRKKWPKHILSNDGFLRGDFTMVQSVKNHRQKRIQV